MGSLYFQAHSDCWQNSLPCGCVIIKGPGFLLDVGWRPPTFPGGQMLFLALWVSSPWLLTLSCHQGDSLNSGRPTEDNLPFD